MTIYVEKDYAAMSAAAAAMLLQEVRENPSAVLGLATGSTPIGMYQAVVKAYEKGEADFSKVVSYNLDEYYPIQHDNDQSYHYFMKENLFKHINILPENTHVPSGESKDVEKTAAEYDAELYQIGGVDLQVLGIGNNGHIGFNEPGVVFAKGTGLVDLTQSTIEANSRFFAAIEDVPKKAVSMGIATIMQAKKIMLMASGQGKAGIIAQTIFGEITPAVPASALQLHRNVTFFLDEAAAAEILPLLK
ncbi:glucosamine-6-phosphate deaminase [Clostridiales bacterium COT073_COT-073]|nr:glucosamine-6-phosphate deaminase [Clostridiales bacterium COT073_COT-073]